MIGTIRRHQTWLWVVIISITVVSFVVFGPTNTHLGNVFGTQNNFGTVSGHAITREDRINAVHEVALDTFFKTQQWPDFNTTETTEKSYYRIFMIQKEKDLGIQVSPQATAALAHRILGDAPLDDFVEKVLKPVGMDDTDFERYLRHELALEQLSQVAGVSGKLVTPQEAEALYKAEHQAIDTDLIYFSASNYLSAVTVTPEIIHQFYTNQLDHYHVPDMVQVDYVKFDVTNYFTSTLTNLTNLDQIVDAYVTRLGTNLFHNTKTPAESRIAARYEVIREYAIRDARRAANKFALDLDKQTPRTNSNLRTLAATQLLSVGTSSPFDREYGPTDIVVPTDFGRKAFSLSFDDPFAGDIVADDGVYVIAFKDRMPASTPPLEKITEKVTEDYRFDSAIQLAQQAALKFQAVLTNALAEGKPFASICAQNGVKYESLPPFSLSTRTVSPALEEKINSSYLKQAAFSTAPGKASAVEGARDGAFIIYVDRQLPLDVAQMKTELPGFTAYVRSMRQNDAFNQWLNAQLSQDPIAGYIRAMNAAPQMKAAGGRPAS